MDGRSEQALFLPTDRDVSIVCENKPGDLSMIFHRRDHGLSSIYGQLRPINSPKGLGYRSLNDSQIARSFRRESKVVSITGVSDKIFRQNFTQYGIKLIHH